MSISFQKKKSIYMSISDDVNTKPAPAVASREKKIADPAKTSSTLNKSRVKMKKEKQANASGRRRRRHNWPFCVCILRLTSTACLHSTIVAQNSTPPTTSSPLCICQWVAAARDMISPCDHIGTFTKSGEPRWWGMEPWRSPLCVNYHRRRGKSFASLWSHT